MNTNQYVTVTVFQLEKIFGDSPEAVEFIGELTKGDLAILRFGICLQRRSISSKSMRSYGKHMHFC